MRAELMVAKEELEAAIHLRMSSLDTLAIRVSGWGVSRAGKPSKPCRAEFWGGLLFRSASRGWRFQPAERGLVRAPKP